MKIDVLWDLIRVYVGYLVGGGIVLICNWGKIKQQNYRGSTMKAKKGYRQNKHDSSFGNWFKWYFRHHTCRKIKRQNRVIIPLQTLERLA